MPWAGRRARENFNPRSPCGERPGNTITYAIWGYFNPRSPCGERRGKTVQTQFTYKNFNPRSPCGERQGHGGGEAGWLIFQSTLSLRRATPGTPHTAMSDRFQSTLSLRRATVEDCREFQQIAISIHALLAESDVSRPKQEGCIIHISIHALLAESDPSVRGSCHRVPISIHALLAESDPCSARR